jgi:hypothetical protein
MNMTDLNANTPSPKGRRWLKRLGWLVGGLIMLVVVAYFVATIGAFFKGVILPKVAAAVNADVSVSEAAISPFSSVVLRELKVAPKGGAPVLAAKSVSVRYDLMAILHGNYLVNEVVVAEPTVTYIQNADGTSNIDPLLKTEKPAAEAKPAPAPAPAGKPAPPPSVDVKSVQLKDATIHYVKNLKGGGRQTVDLSHVNVTAANLKNGADGKLDFSAAIVLAASNVVAQARASGAFTLALSKELKPDGVKGSADVSVEKATGDLADLTALAAKLDCNLTFTEIKQLALRFTKAGADLGELHVSGPFDPAKTEGKLKVEVLSLNRQVLNLAGAASGIDFGTTTVSTSNEVELTKGGDVITVAGTFNVGKFQVTRQSQTTPTLDLQCTYNVSVNRPGQAVSVKALNIAGTQNQQQPLLQAELNSPMTIGWGNAASAVGDAALTVSLTGLNLADWKAFASDYAPAGVANVKLKLLSQAAGNQLAFDLDGQVDQFSAKIDKDQIPTVDVRLLAHGRGVDMKQFSLSEYRLELAQQRQPTLTLSGSGTFDRATTNADIQVTAQAVLGPLANLAGHWVKAAGEYAPSGTANLKLKLQAQGGTKQVAFDLDGQIDQLSAKVDKTQTPPVDVRLVTKGNGTDLKRFSLTEGRLGVTQRGESVLAATATGTFDTSLSNADVQVTAQAALSRLTALYPVTNLTCSAGKLDVTSHLTGKKETQTVTGQLTLAGFTGGYGDYRLADLGTTVDLEVAMKGKLIEIHKAVGQLREGGDAGGKFDLSGNYDLDKKTGQVIAKLADFKENDLRPFLQPSLGDMKLVSVSLNTSLTAGFDAGGDGTIKGEVQLANLVVRDPKNQVPATPFELRLQMDAAISKKIAAVRQCQLTLTPTTRGKNELRLSGTVNYAQTNAISGDLKLAAESLDATAYYDLFTQTSKPSEPAKPSSSPEKSQPTAVPAPSSNTEQTEPAPVTLPVRNFTCDATIGHFYLRELDIANLQTTVKLDGGRVVVKPCQFSLNGAPVSANADLDLSVPGYKYDVTFDANRVPLEPLAKSFSPVYADKAQGNLIANAQIKGMGITGRSLQQNLTGTVALNFTNANIQIVGPKVKSVLTPISIVLGAPELLNSPLDYVATKLEFGSGKIETRQFVAHSVAFEAVSQGTIPIANVLTNSPLNQPVDIGLASGIANRLRFMGSTPPGGYMKLPTFVHLTGTLGDPSAKTDKAVIVGITAGGVAGAVGGKAGGLLQGIGGLLTGQPTGGSQESTTNQPPAQRPLKQLLPINPLDLFKKR